MRLHEFVVAGHLGRNVLEKGKVIKQTADHVDVAQQRREDLLQVNQLLVVDIVSERVNHACIESRIYYINVM